MLTSDQIRKLFHALNDELKNAGELGEVGIVGGSVMCLVYNCRTSTRDVDAVFEPASTIRKLVAKVGLRVGVEPDWLNDAVKGFLEGEFKRIPVLNLSNLRVWAPEPRYMLAMKCLSARWDSHDREDVIFLIRLLEIAEPKQVFDIIEGYYPKHRILPKTQFFIEEILDRPRKKKKK